jgi:kynurenine formamidase
MMSVLQDFVGALQLGAVTVVDLTQPLGPDTPVIGLPPIFGQSSSFSSKVISHYDDRGPAWAWSDITLGEHTGTHFDAPVHWITGRDQPNNTLDTIPPGRFVAPAVVIDATDRCTADPDFLLTVDDVLAWEADHGRIPAGSWVLLRSGWSARKDAAFLNVTESGAHNPGPAPALVTFLIQERDVLGWGTECVGTDAGQAFLFDPPFPCHAGMHGANRYGLASLVNLDQLPPTGAVLVTAPLKIVDGTGSPLRVLALVETA